MRKLTNLQKSTQRLMVKIRKERESKTLKARIKRLFNKVFRRKHGTHNK